MFQCGEMNGHAINLVEAAPADRVNLGEQSCDRAGVNWGFYPQPLTLEATAFIL